MTTQALAEPPTLPERESIPASSSNEEPHRAINLMLVGFVTILVGAGLGIIGKKLLLNEVAAVIGALISLVGMFLLVYPNLVPPRRRKQNSAPPSQPEQFARSEPAAALPQKSAIEYVPSVTERTTGLLKDATATRPQRKEDGESHS